MVSHGSSHGATTLSVINTFLEGEVCYSESTALLAAGLPTESIVFLLQGGLHTAYSHLGAQMLFHVVTET